MDRQTLLLNAISWARQAGAITLRHFRSGQLDIRSKLNDSDIVTVADKASEQFLIDRIHAVYPDHSILSEESGSESRDSGWRWVIDPLDGTTNYSQGLPIYSISIGIELNGVTQVGVVYAPRLDELFHAVRGEGAFLNGVPIHVSDKSDLAHSVISTGFPVTKHVNPDNNLDNFARIMPRVRGIRRLGSAAVDISYVAAGFLDGFWELGLHQWDVAAALLILEEAGGVAIPFRHDRDVSIIAAAPAIAPLLKELVADGNSPE